MIFIVLGYWYLVHIPRAIIDELHEHEYSVLSEQLHGSHIDNIRRWLRCELLVNTIKEINFTGFVSEKKTLVYYIAFDDDSYANMFVFNEDNHWKINQLFFSTYHDKECLQDLRSGVSQSMETGCEHLSEIKVLPFKHEHVDDRVYNTIISNGKKSIPCLLESIQNTTKMQDPRKSPPFDGIVVGDTAFFVLLDIVNEPLESFLPISVKEEFKEKGSDAYFNYIKLPQNRQKLYETLKNRSSYWLKY